MVQTRPREKRKRNDGQDTQSTPPKKARNEGPATQKAKTSKSKRTKDIAIKGRANPRSTGHSRTVHFEEFNKQCHRFPAAQVHDAFIMFLEEFRKLKAASPTEQQERWHEAKAAYSHFKAIHAYSSSLAILEETLPAMMEEDRHVETAMNIFEKLKEDGINSIAEAMQAIGAEQHNYNAATEAELSLETGFQVHGFEEDYLGELSGKITIPEAQKLENLADSALEVAETQVEEHAGDLDLDVAEDRPRSQSQAITSKHEPAVPVSAEKLAG